ncbi:MAG: TRAP transporter substrate-binding protein [Spirochaetia bacterium]|nr:TRAP transporter substrate-binding protein [Spirochaetia bacterium]
MNKRKGMCILMSLVMLISTNVFAAGQQDSATKVDQEKKVQIRLSHTHQADAESSEIHYAATVFKEYVESHSDSLEVQIFAANALGEERAVYEGMQLGGGASAVISGTAILGNFNKKVGVLDLPFLWGGYDHVHAVLDGEVGAVIREELRNDGFEVLAWMDSWGFRNVVTSKKEIKNPSDLKGLKIRTIPTPIYLVAVNAMGANATPMSFGEVYTSMQTGVLDGFEHGASVVKAERFYEVASFISMTRHLFGPLAFVYSSSEWAKLNEEQKEVVKKATEVARDAQREKAPAKEAEGFAFLKDQGMKITEIDTSDFEKAAMGIQDEIASELGATDLLKIIRNAR